MGDFDTKQLRADALGFSGRFFYDGERGDIAWIAAECDARTCDCEEKPNSDGDQDCSISLIDGLDDHVAEPMARMLNAVRPLLDELEAAKALLSTIKPDQPATQYQCVACNATMRTWRDFPEYQHVDCGGLVRLRALIERDALRSQLAAVTEALNEACALAEVHVNSRLEATQGISTASLDAPTLCHADLRRIAELRKAPR